MTATIDHADADLEALGAARLDGGLRHHHRHVVGHIPHHDDTLCTGRQGQQ
jgi:hypothetical protein